MPITKPFDEHSDMYEQWFSTFKTVYDSEVEVLKEVLPGKPAGAASSSDGTPVGLEIGAGSGLFASRLGTHYGVEPSKAMLEKAVERGIEMKEGVAEDLPYEDESFDYSLMVTAVCFLDDMGTALDEIRRILKPGGWAVFGFVDKDSPLGQVYLAHKDEDPFYREATFRSASELIESLQRHGFEIEQTRQTVFGKIDEIDSVQSSREGHGEGGFVVLRARKK